MKIFILATTLAICQASFIPDISHEWISFKRSHNKRYTTPSEEHYRLTVFTQNKKLIDEHNKNYDNGLASFHMKMNRFGDLTHEEFRALMTAYNKTRSPRKSASLFIAPENVKLPSSIDWRQKGAVTPVKDQGQCGSCWAFSTTGSLEGQHFLKTGKLVALSEQQLVDCSEDNQGCDGGLMDDAFTYIKENGGVESENSYPYEASKNECRFKKNKVVASDSGYVDIPEGDENSLQKAVGTVGPVSIGIDAGQRSFQFYSKGVYYDRSCNSDELNHGVLVVGYGSEEGQDYWIVKNSWNTNWGESGYIKIARNKRNHCGIATKASYPLV